MSHSLPHSSMSDLTAPPTGGDPLNDSMDSSMHHGRVSESGNSFSRQGGVRSRYADSGVIRTTATPLASSTSMGRIMPVASVGNMAAAGSVSMFMPVAAAGSDSGVQQGDEGERTAGEGGESSMGEWQDPDLSCVCRISPTRYYSCCIEGRTDVDSGIDSHSSP